MNAIENADANVQAMRDQGIADALAGVPPFARLIGNGWIDVRFADGVGVILPSDENYREAFAYARAYEANQ